ncbi:MULTISPECIES: hypothetical protein [unclassified Arsenophonus]|uniref:hypothetical protein n=1 Tax=unclassified Arsenophonus TaxID=2627083 RepID=UPI002865A66E|nr:hypothetical protein [Arsenophonus sp.]MDR5610230.1 hypothetical protein [Arsenophonus sp.]MDR5614032.1 hypothetical protein [Arsenophonus sp.]
MNRLKLTIALSSCLLLAACDKQTEITMSDNENKPIPLAIKMMGNNFQPDVSNVVITQRTNRVESPDSVEVSIVESGLLDDSVEAIKTIFTFILKDDKWILEKPQDVLIKCYEGRGHKDFSPETCG